MSAQAARTLLSIGDVIATLRPEFGDVSVSKIRFLESEGLVAPARTPSGYRKFSPGDVERLRYVLTAQRDHYLPLRVIKERLDRIDAGESAPLDETGPRGPRALVSADDLPTAGPGDPAAPEPRFTRAELLEESGLSTDQLAELESYGLVVARRRSTPFDSDDLTIAKAVAEMARFGLEPRHLRAFKSAADREAGLVEQVVAPMRQSRDPEAGARADEAIRELAALSVQLHAALVRTAIGRERPR